MLNRKFLAAPPASLRALELRAAADVLALPLWLTRLASRKLSDIGQDRAVFVLPGFGAGDGAMAPMRYFLRRHGFKPVEWGLGVNKAGLNFPHDPHMLSWDLDIPEKFAGETGVPFLCDQMVERVSRFCEEHSTTASLVGWSLGGTIAREVARDLPQYVDQVVTLGSPVIGGPKYTSAAPILSKRGLDLDWIEREVERRNQRPIKPPVSAIVSRTDGIVDWSASILADDSTTRYIDTDVPHLGMGINRSVMGLVLEELTRERTRS